MEPEDDQVIDPRPATPEVPDVPDLSGPPSVVYSLRSVHVESMETPWLESPPTDQSILSREPSSGRVRPVLPDRHYRSSPYLAELSQRSKREFLKRRGILDCCDQQESESDSSAASSTSSTPELVSPGMDVLGGSEEGPRCKID